MKRIFFLLCMVCSLSANVKAQQTGTFIDKVYLGGNFTFNYGRFYDVFEVAPNVGYYITPQFVLGSGVSFSRYGYRYEFQEKYYKSSDKYYGLSFFTRYYLSKKEEQILNNVYIHGEYEYLKSKLNSRSVQSDKKVYSHWVPLAGIGYRQILKNRFALSFSLLFDLKDADHSPYRNPIMRIGIEF
ncbi:hypothetical protein EYV94_01395 [Puteibacter caeruleilacunae]|nr:hypothetical protein EYV94_01395 [Puteibacter caeruleilacunae]